MGVVNVRTRTRDELTTARKAALSDLEHTEWGAQVLHETRLALAERMVGYNLTRGQLERLLIGLGITAFMNMTLNETQIICHITGAPVLLVRSGDDLPF